MEKNKINVKDLGILKLFDTFVVYEYPLVFVCNDSDGKLYLFMEEKASEDSEEWVVIEITSKRYNELLKNKISIQEAYRKNEGRNYYWITHTYNEEVCDCRIERRLPLDCLTKYNTYVDI